MSVHMCLFPWNLAENVDLQTLQKKGLLVCNCLFKAEFIENADPQISEEIAFSPQYVWLVLFKGEWTLIKFTKRWFLSSLCLQMHFQMGTLWKCGSTNFTRKCFLFNVGFHSIFQLWNVKMLIVHSRENLYSTEFNYSLFSNLFYEI